MRSSATTTNPTVPPGGYLRDKRGRFTRIDFPGAAYVTIHGINDRGQIVGVYIEGGVTPNPDGTVRRGMVHGFLWDRGRFTTTRRPRIERDAALRHQRPWRDVGRVLRRSRRNQHGFVLEKGRYTTIDAPRPIDDFSNGDIACGINDRGEIVHPRPQRSATSGGDFMTFARKRSVGRWRLSSQPSSHLRRSR